MAAPVIGITTRPRLVPSSVGESEAHTLYRTYTDSVLRAGGVPVLLSPVPTDRVGVLLDRVDGVVLTGGGDVDPTRYGSTADDTMYGIDFDRDEFEFAVARETQRRRMPVLAICRGLQVVNVAFGGTLVEDIPREYGSLDHTVIGQAVFAGHQKVTLDPGCLVARAVGRTELCVNSIHHQAVREVAQGLRIVGRAGDGVPEAIEHDDDAWPMLAVQWHPEYLADPDNGGPADEASSLLFSALVDYAARSATV